MATKAAARDYATTTLSIQHTTGGKVGPALKLWPEATTAQLVAAVKAAPPEGKWAAMETLSKIVETQPPTVRLTDGTTLSPQAMAVQELMDKGLGQVDAMTLVDFAGAANAGKRAQAVRATDQPFAQGSVERRRQAQPANPRGERAARFPRRPVALPGQDALRQAREQRTELVALDYVQSQHMKEPEAARRAVADFAGAYRGRHLLMPKDQAGKGFGYNGPNGWGVDNGADLVRTGAQHVLASITTAGDTSRSWVIRAPAWRSMCPIAFIRRPNRNCARRPMRRRSRKTTSGRP